MNAPEYDLHLAAGSISPTTAQQLTALGFRPDGFSNYMRCHTGEFHASFCDDTRPIDERLWRQVCDILDSDPAYSGYLEMEEEPAEFMCRLPGLGPRHELRIPLVSVLPCTAQMRKACDLHIGIELRLSTPDAIRNIELLELSSVDKRTPSGTRRVYTVTFECVDDGIQVFHILKHYLTALSGLCGKIKLEKVVRCFRKPADAIMLPIVTRDAAKAWTAIAGLELSHNVASPG